MDSVDAHVHILTKLSDEFPREVGGLAPADREGTAEQLLQEMEAAGIDRAVLIDMGGTAIEHHNYVTHCVKKWPGRFAATGLIDLSDPDPPERLRELVEATGIKGIRLGSLGAPDASRPEDLTAYGLFQCAEELGLNINIYGRGDQVSCIEMLARAFPRVNVSLDHLGFLPSTSMRVDRWGRPWFPDEPTPPPTHARVLELAQYPNVYVKVSGEYAFSKRPYPYEDMTPVVEQVYRAYGPERMMWCTDFPWIVEEPGYEKLADLLDIHLPALTPSERELIMGGNALEVWFNNR